MSLCVLVGCETVNVHERAASGNVVQCVRGAGYDVEMRGIVSVSCLQRSLCTTIRLTYTPEHTRAGRVLGENRTMGADSGSAARYFVCSVQVLGAIHPRLCEISSSE